MIAYLRHEDVPVAGVSTGGGGWTLNPRALGVALQPGERIVNVETVQPNTSGYNANTFYRIWIEGQG